MPLKTLFEQNPCIHLRFKKFCKSSRLYVKSVRQASFWQASNMGQLQSYWSDYIGLSRLKLSRVRNGPASSSQSPFYCRQAAGSAGRPASSRLASFACLTRILQAKCSLGKRSLLVRSHRTQLNARSKLLVERSETWSAATGWERSEPRT